MKQALILLFIGLGLASAIAAIIMAFQVPSYTTVGHAGGAAGFGISFGLCMIAAAMVWGK